MSEEVNEAVRHIRKEVEKMLPDIRLHAAEMMKRYPPPTWQDAGEAITVINVIPDLPHSEARDQLAAQATHLLMYLMAHYEVATSGIVDPKAN